ncbi:ribonuclease H-like domain-containing protein [Tanacetum coccineum]|uniref:Ribonuclease H-like domain-containing protein n=1 Tax=Tanacetum coccineum TaxID=301880 RepID=A0ABQ5I8F6_9ASTR
MQLRSNILSRDPLPNATDTYVLISSEESHRAVIIGSRVGSSQRTQSSVFKSSVNNKGGAQRSQTFSNTSRLNNVTRPDNNGNRRAVSGPTLVSEHCGFNGHTIDRCFKLIGHPADFGKKNNSSNNNQNFKAYFFNKKNSLNDKWKSFQANMAVSHPNGIEALITKVGNLVLIDFLTLYDVLVVPEYCVTLVSVHKVARDIKFIAGFDESKCFLMSQDLMGVKITGIGKQVGGLYYFDSITENIHCDICQKAKQTKEPFPLSEHKSSALDQLVHLDLWGPYKVVAHHDKFGSRAEKCVLVGYSSFKKGYKLFSLERKQFIFLRDVKFFERVFPFKIKHSSVDKNSQDLDHDDLGHPHGSNGFVSENEMAATSKHDSALSEGDDADIPNTEHIEAMNKEMKALYDNDTWEITELPSDRKAIGSKWVFKITYKSNGDIERYKARLIAKCFNQKEGVDFDETFSPVVNIPTVGQEDGTTRTKKYEELSATEKLQADCDLKATNIVLQGLPPMCTNLSLQEKECKLYDEFDKFSFVKGETLYQYYWRFSQLINNINDINMSMRPVQVNMKFLNSLPPEWSKFVMGVKLARDLHTTNYDQLYL